LEPELFVLACISLSLFYVGGMYLNDAFDREIDAEQRPERPIPSGAVSARTVFASGFSMLAAGDAILWTQNWRAGCAGIALAATIVLYDWHHKENPFGPVVMGMCRVFVYVAAALLVATTLGQSVLLGAAVLLGYLVGLTYTAKQEMKASFGAIWPLALLFAPLVYALRAGAPEPGLLGLAVVFVGWLIWALRALQQRKIGPAVGLMICGISLVDALLIASAGQPMVAMTALLAVPLTFGLQRVVPGT